MAGIRGQLGRVNANAENILPCEPSPSPRRKTGPARSTPRVSEGKEGGFSISRRRSACHSPRAPPGNRHPRTRTYPHEESILYGVAPVRRHGPCHNVCDMLTTGSAEKTSQNNVYIPDFSRKNRIFLQNSKIFLQIHRNTVENSKVHPI